MGSDLQKRRKPRLCLFKQAMIRGKKILINALLALLSTLAVMSIILIAVVLFYHNGITKLRWPVGAHRYNEDVGFEMTPGFSAEMLDNSFYVKTHQLGFRIPEFQDSKSVKKGGILAIGCSYTFGDEVEAEKTFTWQTAAKLGLPAYNYGVCSYSYACSILQLQQLEKSGLLDELSPRIIILGVGSWLYKRSLSPFFPTNGPQFAYAYIEKVNGEIEIVQPNEFYSSKHLYALVPQYFEDISQNRVITFKQFKLLAANLPRMFLAKLHKKQQDKKIKDGLTNISREELYTFVIKNAYDIAARHNSQLVVLWMPYRSSDTVEQEMVLAVNKFRDVILVNGREALIRHRVPKEQYRHMHPQPMAHLAYAEEILRSIEIREQ